MHAAPVPRGLPYLTMAALSEGSKGLKLGNMGKGNCQ